MVQLNFRYNDETEAVIETGKVARQASGAVTVQVGGTVVLVAVVSAPNQREGQDFFPLMVDYREKFYAVGRFPGGFFKREARPSDGETLRARLIDRSLRPLFPEGYSDEVQVYVTVLSMDQKNPAEILALIGASAALYISDIPFSKPVAAVRIGRFEGNLVLNPTLQQLERSDLDLVVAGTKTAITMVESGAKEVSEEVMLDALEFGHKSIVELLKVQEDLRKKVGKPKQEVVAVEKKADIKKKVAGLAKSALPEIGKIFDKLKRQKKYDEELARIKAALAEEFPEGEKEIAGEFAELYYHFVREQILDEGIRADGRKTEEIRPITCEVGVLPCAHGTALFTRGQTQSLGVVTLGTMDDQQTIDNLLGVSSKRFMLHYNFPSYSVGEVRVPRGPGRREIGHGALAERALEAVLPVQDEFPYTIRVVSEILESNGSSSMASVCAGCLALMDAGVPIKAPVAGIAMGLIAEGGKIAILTDIQGLEDHLGDMDFKVTGTAKGITALQMDIKIEGVDHKVLSTALEQARRARLKVLATMLETLAEPRPDLSPNAPRITVLQINPAKIRDVIGPGGKIIRSIIEKTGCKIDIEDDGKVYIASLEAEGSRRAIEMVRELTMDVEIGRIYTGKVVKIMNFGAFVEILPGRDGLVHISELDEKRIRRVEDVCREGDMLTVKVIGIEEGSGKVKLSRKAAAKELAEVSS
ncbi:MAG: polyribonucleotide nucleotidyltransferase [bacterium]